jgi:NhaP-type Na+/H+ and K+/H+ antiporter
MSWVLHFVFGAGVGALIGLGVGAPGRRRWNFRWLESGLLPEFMIGCVLLSASLGSLHGERLWTGLSYHVILPEGIEHSLTSRVLSILSGIAGATLIAKVLLANFGVI